jgi:stage V sporulation protein G
MAEPIGVEVIRLRRFEDEQSKLKAFVDVAIGEFIIKGLRILQGQKGLFIAMPQEQGKDGRWYSCVYPKNPQAHQALTEVVLAAYQE